jgi:hypothetical protein
MGLPRKSSPFVQWVSAHVRFPVVPPRLLYEMSSDFPNLQCLALHRRTPLLDIVTVPAQTAVTEIAI